MKVAAVQMIFLLGPQWDPSPHKWQSCDNALDRRTLTGKQKLLGVRNLNSELLRDLVRQVSVYQERHHLPFSAPNWSITSGNLT